MSGLEKSRGTFTNSKKAFLLSKRPYLKKFPDHSLLMKTVICFTKHQIHDVLTGLKHCLSRKFLIIFARLNKEMPHEKRYFQCIG